jgi:putative selenium metabolism protein SsnA
MIITNASLITWEYPNRFLENQAIFISGDHIHEIGPSAKIEKLYPKSRKLDAHGQFVMPGNICAHTHFYSAFSRGLNNPGLAPKDFPEILEKLWWPLDKSLLEDDIRYSALISLVDAIKHGTTTLIDHHASPNAIDGSLDIIAETVDQSGLRAVLCYEVSDRDGPEKADAGIKENVRFLKRLATNPHSRLAGTFGLHASTTLSGATLQACRVAAPQEAGFHIHVAEHEEDEYDSLNKSNMHIIDRLQVHEILGPKTIAAHCVHIDAREMELLKETSTWVTHQPRSNMNNAVGTAPIESMMRIGIKVCLGNDGFSNCMWDEWKEAYYLHKATSRDPRRMNANDVAKMAIYNNSALASTFFPDTPIGQIVPGSTADLIFIDYQSPTDVTPDNLPWHIIFGFQQSMITTTIVAGKILMKDRELVTLDEARISARARELSRKVWKRYQDKFKV